MSIDINRLLMEVEHDRKSINREILNPAIDVLSISDLRPLMHLIARARSDYLQYLLSVCHDTPDGVPDSEQVAGLKQRRRVYEELVSASQALTGAIEKGYLDIAGKG